MKILINGESFGLEQEQTNLASALSLYIKADQGGHSFAVAVNGDFVGKAAYNETSIQDGDSIDVLFPIQGG